MLELKSSSHMLLGLVPSLLWAATIALTTTVTSKYNLHKAHNAYFTVYIHYIYVNVF